MIYVQCTHSPIAMTIAIAINISYSKWIRLNRSESNHAHLAAHNFLYCFSCWVHGEQCAISNDSFSATKLFLRRSLFSFIFENAAILIDLCRKLKRGDHLIWMAPNHCDSLGFGDCFHLCNRCVKVFMTSLSSSIFCLARFYFARSPLISSFSLRFK